MTEQVSQAELQALRDRVAELEASRNQPQVVEVEGFEGLRQLSKAIETKNLDAFLIDRSLPDREFWGIFVGIIVFALLMAFLAMYQNSL